MKNFEDIAKRIENATGKAFRLKARQAVAGGDINAAFWLEGLDCSYFVKLNHPELVSMFAAEAAGLKEMAATRTVTVPEPIVCGQTTTHGFLVLEYLEFGRSTDTSYRQLGKQLAELHQQQQPFFGWHVNNTIGSTPQINTRSSNWLEFWRDQRLGFQLQLAEKKGFTGSLQTQGDKLRSYLSVLFTDYQPQASLLHGDLWGGNAAVDKKGCPVIFDPACYYGDRETDIAMTELFGGFNPDFYAAYQDVWALDSGFSVRKTLYNLYHILNHLNLFGGSYLRQAENMTARLLAEVC
jgi:fructosamine-3-kinase